MRVYETDPGNQSSSIRNKSSFWSHTKLDQISAHKPNDLPKTN